MRKLITIIAAFITLTCYAEKTPRWFSPLFTIRDFLTYYDTDDPYYVSTTGNDITGDGSMGNPWATLQKAIDVSIPGDTTYIRGGTYYPTDHIYFTPEETPAHGVSGTYTEPICYFNYPGETPIIDFSNLPEASYNVGFNMQYVEHIKIKGIQIKSVYQFRTELGWFGVGISAYYVRNLHFENLVIHDISGRGVDINGGAWKSMVDDGFTAEVPFFADEIDTTRFINCDFYNIRDTLSPNPGNGADAVIQNHYRGNYVLFDGCRAWEYSDDAWDVHIINGAKVVFNNCWAMASNRWADYDIEGSGWKMSALYFPSKDTSLQTYTIKNCLALYCPGYGFANNFFVSYANYRSLYTLFYNNTSYRNGTGFSEPQSEDDPYISRTVYKNNISYDNALYFGTPNNFYSGYVDGLTESHNSQDWVNPGDWIQWEDSDTVTVSDADFVTVDSLTLVALFTASRQADGSLPVARPLMLAASSDLVNAGTDVGLPYNYTAPDIGYAEYNSGETIPVEQIGVAPQSGDATITTYHGSKQLVATVLPFNATNQTVTWSVIPGSGNASINASTGLLTAISDGTVLAIATATDGSNVTGSLEVTISNQIPPAPSGNFHFKRTAGGWGKTIHGNRIK